MKSLTSLLRVSLLCLLSFHVIASEVNVQAARQGVMDLKNWRIDLAPMVALSGEWLFYEGQLLSLADLSERPIPSSKTFPTPLLQCTSSSNQLRQTMLTPEIYAPSLPDDYGCIATYVLELRNIPIQPLALMIPELSTAFKLAWNGQIIAEGGVVSDHPGDYKPYVGHRLVTLPASDGGGVLTLQVANWVNADSVARNLILGDASDLQAYYAQGELLEALSAAIAGIGWLLLMIQQNARR